MEKKDYRLSYDFSDKVMAQINHEIVVREKKNRVLMVVGCALASVLAVAAILFALVYFKVMPNISSIFSVESISLPSFSFALIFDTVKTYSLYFAVGINIVILYIIGERFSSERNIKRINKTIEV